MSSTLVPRPPPEGSGDPDTRTALLRAAGEVFAEAGFRAATVRQICQRAGVNIAAVNYHFRDKTGLYLEVLRYAHARARERHPDDTARLARATPAVRLHAFVRGLLRRLLDPGPTAWHGKLVAMEMINPSTALDHLIEEPIRPLAEDLRRIVTDVLGPGADPETVRLCGSSILSQCLFYRHCQSVIQRLFPQQRFGSGDIDRLADHIARFSLAALRQYPARRRPLANPRRRSNPPYP